MNRKSLRAGVSRRTVMAAGLAGAGVLAMPNILRAQDRSLKVGVYGGYLQSSFDEHIFPAFTKASGIAVEAVAAPTGEAWLVQLGQRARGMGRTACREREVRAGVGSGVSG